MTTMGNVLPDLSQEIARLRAENEAMRARLARQANRKLNIKVSDKGGLSVYGLGRWPVTLYRSQWVRLLDAADDIRQALVDNADSLTDKAD